MVESLSSEPRRGPRRSVSSLAPGVRRSTIRRSVPRRVSQLAPLLACTAALALSASGCITLDLGGNVAGVMHETVVFGSDGPKVLMLDIDGEITDSDAAGVLGWVLSEGTVSRVRDELNRADKEGDIAAILLRIDSPGGSPTASDSVYRQLTAFKKKHGIPVFAQLMSTAASGGYYIAVAADRILASPTTITGSIGVIMLGVNLSGLMDKIGVTNQTLTSGGYKDAGSFLRPMEETERAQLQSVVDDLYSRFVDVVNRGRAELPEERIRELADGRIYSAPQALEAGLVDGISPLEQTIAALTKHLGVPGLRVVSYHRMRENPTNIYSRTTLHEPIKIQSGAVPHLFPRPGFYYLWWPGVR